MANVSKLTIGSTTYDIKDSSASLCYNLSNYMASGKTLPADYYKAIFHLSGEPAEMKYVKTNVNATECSPLATNTQYIVFGINRQEASNCYYWYIVYKYSDRTYVGSYNSTSGSTKRPTILNKAFFNETVWSDITGYVDDYYNENSIIRTIEFTDNIGTELECCITDRYSNETGCTVPCATVNRAGVMTKADKQLLSKIAGVLGPVDITNSVKTWLSDNQNGKDTTSSMSSGCAIKGISATTDTSSSIKIDLYRTLYFTITEDTPFYMGTNTTSWTITPGTYVCNKIDGRIPSNSVDNGEAYYTFNFISSSSTIGGIKAPKIAIGYIHVVYKHEAPYYGWVIERIGKSSLSYLAS